MNSLITEDFFKLGASLLAGAIIGAEREYKSKNAGFRTITLVTLGATLFTIISGIIADGKDYHVVGNIVVGIGFLGAGAIFKEGSSPKGLTTAVTIWVSAAIGMAIGAGQYEFAGMVLLMVMLVLLGFTPLQRFIDNYNNERTYKITVFCSNFNIEELHATFSKNKLKSICVYQNKRHDTITLTFKISGSEENHLRMLQSLSDNPHVIEFEG
ncbi:MAG: MgtC/SapB family protein [Bacteroidia bacterium]